MWKRFLNYLKGLFSAETKLLNDPERLLTNAQKELCEKQAVNRKRAVEAVTARNNLQQQCAEMRSRIEKLTAKINEAERCDDNEKAEKLRHERDKYEEILLMMKTQLARATEMCEQAMRAIQREEEKIRQKTHEALELKAQWRGSQLPPPIDMRPFNALFIIALLILVLFIVLVLVAGLCSRYLSASAL